MGDPQLCSPPREYGYALRDGIQNPVSFSHDCWVTADKAAYQIILTIEPNAEADKKRKDIIDYIQTLIKSCLGCEVFPYGSVPLKTYLPDGDIDLTTISGFSVEASVVYDVQAILKREEQNGACPYEVRDVHCIDAEVKLVKFLVDNIVVDVSFNQFGGISALRFLEQLDFIVGKDHLFKRSIILIKAWCFYESRTLGAHHGLISTYALEMLILYIFHLFHSSLNGPLAVLYKFLDYFSKFDWDTYCISLNGPVFKCSLPNKVAVEVENGGDGLLLSKEFLSNCADTFSFSSLGKDAKSRAFPQKYLNIIDPLKENNNLGRSVNKANFYRIRSAFRRGAWKLGQILALPSQRIANELNRFFANTLERHGTIDWSDPKVSALHYRAKILNNLLPSSDSNDNSFLKPSIADYSKRRAFSMKVGSQYSLCAVCSQHHRVADKNAVLQFSLSQRVKEVSSLLLKENGIVANAIEYRDKRKNSLINYEDVIPAPGCSLSAIDVTEELLSRQLSYSCSLYPRLLSSPPFSPRSPTEKNGNSQRNRNIVVQSRPHSRDSSFGSQGKFKSQGIGTYFPKVMKDKLSSRKGRKVCNSQLHEQPRDDNKETASLQGTNVYGEGCDVLSLEEFPVLGGGKAAVPCASLLLQTSVWGGSHANLLSSSSSERTESSSDDHDVQIEENVILLASSNLSDSGLTESAAESCKPVVVKNQEKMDEQSYHLRDEADFPPLIVV